MTTDQTCERCVYCAQYSPTSEEPYGSLDCTVNAPLSRLPTWRIDRPNKCSKFKREKASTARDGKCCSCGYEGSEETPCESREDETHCVHWWDGPEEEKEAVVDRRML